MGPGHLRQAVNGAVNGEVDGDDVTHRGNQRSVESVGAGAGSSAQSLALLGWGVFHGLEPPGSDVISIGAQSRSRNGKRGL